MLGDEAKRRPEMMQDFIASQVISAYRWMGLGLVDLEGGGPGDQPVKRCDLKFGQARPRSSIGCLFNGGRPGQQQKRPKYRSCENCPTVSGGEEVVPEVRLR